MIKKLSTLLCVLCCLVACEEYNDAPEGDPTAATAKGEGTTETGPGSEAEKNQQPDEQVEHAHAQASDKAAATEGKSHDLVMAERIHEELDRLGRDDLCELLDESMIREVFELGEDANIQKHDRPLLCSYLWDKDDVTYRLGFNFSPAQPSDAEAARTQWEAVKLIASYKESEQQEVADLGDDAIWSSFDGGQLRVLSGSDIFYISLARSNSAWIAAEAGVTPPNVEKMSKGDAEKARASARDESRADAVALAAKIIEKL